MTDARAPAVAGLLAVLLAGCSDPPPSREPGSDGARPGRSAVRALQGNEADPAQRDATAPAARPSAVRQENDLYVFSYDYPAAAAAIPALARALDADRARLLAALRSDAETARREAAADGFEYRPHSTEVSWKVVTRTPRLLSLSSQGYAFTGGAHGMPSYDALLWDRQAGRRVDPWSVFGSAADLSAAVRPAFCRALDAQRRDRRGSDWRPARGAPDGFDSCPALGDATLLLGATDGRAIDRIGLILGPYVAGPYSEGAYEITLPVTGAVLARVQPGFRDAVAAR